jgi:hypothetical protein
MHYEFSFKRKYSFNNGYTYLRDNNEAVNRESVVVIYLPTNKICQLLTSNWTFVREQTLGLLFCVQKVDWILKYPCNNVCSSS